MSVLELEARVAEAESEVAAATTALEQARARFEESGNERDAKAIAGARERIELAELHVWRNKRLLERGQQDALAAERQAKMQQYRNAKTAVESKLAEEEPLIQLEAKLILQLVDVRVARSRVRAEAEPLVNTWKLHYEDVGLEVDVQLTEAEQQYADEKGLCPADQLESKRYFAKRDNPWMKFELSPDAAAVRKAAKNIAEFENRPGVRDPRPLFLDAAMPTDSMYVVPYLPVNPATGFPMGEPQEYIPWAELRPLMNTEPKKRNLFGM
jgi:hypothetical protein